MSAGRRVAELSLGDANGRRMSDHEKTAIDWIYRPALVGRMREAASILATASSRFD